MLATAYILPFEFALPTTNPWTGRVHPELVVVTQAPLSPEASGVLLERLAPFWRLADAGGLGGSHVAPWTAACPDPVVQRDPAGAVLRFPPCTLDEKATSCLLCLLLTAHAEVPIRRATLRAAGLPSDPIALDPNLDDPYPGPWPALPFTATVADSEQETRILRLQFSLPLDDEQLDSVKGRLLDWGAAATEGAFAVAPVPPPQSGCLVDNAIEHYEGELVWAVEKCRFDPRGALDSLVAVCAAMHQLVAPIAELEVE